ncbi:exosome complex component RRP40 [Atheta coriaria]|uniref:exosome complex component RRP40 n=1 Tax=Dalotia coriaria TaxID=877792 RepID=UPI0031F36797
MEVKIDDLVLPGDIFTPNKPPKNVIVLGPGLRRFEETNELLITKSGFLKHKQPSIYWIDCNQSKYIPKRGDFVVGIVSRKAGEIFKVDIGSAEQASLSVYAFEGATKRQKPDIRIGDAVFARVLSARKEMEPDLVCVDRQMKSRSVGKLPAGGLIVTIPMSLAYRLLSGENELLQTMGKKNAFEVAIGVNGRIWINARTPSLVLRIMNALASVDGQSNKSINDLCRRQK